MKRKGYRLTQCAGKVEMGAWKGERCKRTKLLPVDKNDNTKNYYCASHKR
jgi:hypothetical protein